MVSALSRTVFPAAYASRDGFLTVFNTIAAAHLTISPPPAFTSIIDALTLGLVVSHKIGQCLLAMNFDSRATQRLFALIHDKLPGSPSAVFAAQTTNINVSEAPGRFLPPSYFRAFLRVFLSSDVNSRRVPHVLIHRALLDAGLRESVARVSRDVLRTIWRLG
jgi:hypothetical protein